MYKLPKAQLDKISYYNEIIKQYCDTNKDWNLIDKINKNNTVNYYPMFLLLFLMCVMTVVWGNWRESGMVPVKALSHKLKISRRMYYVYYKRAVEEGLIIPDELEKISYCKFFVRTFKSETVDNIQNYLLERHGFNVSTDKYEQFFWDVIDEYKLYTLEQELQSLTGDEREAKLLKIEAYNNKREEKERKKQEKVEELMPQYQPFINILEELDTDSKYLTEYKLRLTNPLCKTKNPKRDNSRINLLKEQFNTDTIFDSDTEASMYRVNYLLVTGTPYKGTLYKDWFNLCNFNIDWDEEKVKPLFKTVCMPIYMAPHTIMWNSMRYNNIKWQVERKWTLTKADKEFYKEVNELEQLFNLPYKQIMLKIRHGAQKLLKGTYRGEIFIHESNLHILILKKLKDMGIQVANVYDCFYTDVNIQNNYQQIWDECAMELLNMYEQIGVELPYRKFIVM